MIKTTFAALTVMATAGIASAASVTFDFDIENFGGSAQTVIDFDFALGAIQSIDSVEIELAHSWADDIDFVLTGSGGEVFDLVTDRGSNRDLGDGGSSLSGVATYVFVATGGDPIWASTFNGAPIAGGTYNAETWQSGPFAAGTWNIFLGDDATGDDGAVGSITINYTIPAPGALALVGLGGLAAARRRRA